MTSSSQDRVDGFTVTKAVKAPVKAATHSDNITLSGEQTIDGVSVTDGDRVLVKDQTDSAENGIYLVKENAWERTKDFNGARDVSRGTLVRVVEGTVNAGSYWAVNADSYTITIGTDDITFTPDNNVLGEGVLEEGVVTLFSLSDDVLSLITAGAEYLGDWATSTSYETGGMVSQNGLVYIATEDHTSGTFSTDLNAGKWILVSGQRLSIGDDIASGSELNVNKPGVFHDVTGTTTVTSFASLDSGISKFKVLQFDGALILTHDGTSLILPGGVNHTTAAGEIILFYEYEADKWRMIATSRSVNYGSGATEDLNFKDKVLSRAEIKDYSESRAQDTNANGAVNVNLENGNVQQLTLTGNALISFTNPPSSGRAGNITLLLKQDGTGGHTINFNNTIKWAGGEKPNFSTAANAEDIVTLFTLDGGSTWYGFLAGINVIGDSSPSYSHGTNGYTTLPDGTILQWGQADIPSGSTVNVVFDDEDGNIDFPNNCFQGYASGQEHDPGESTSAAVGANNFSTTGLTLWNNNNTTITASWWTVGN